jgi:hypothetical protein
VQPYLDANTARHPLFLSCYYYCLQDGKGGRTGAGELAVAIVAAVFGGSWRGGSADADVDFGLLYVSVFVFANNIVVPS